MNMMGAPQTMTDATRFELQLPTLGPDSFPAMFVTSFEAPTSLVEELHVLGVGGPGPSHIEFAKIRRTGRTREIATGFLVLADRGESVFVRIQIDLRVGGRVRRSKIAFDDVLSVVAKHVTTPRRWRVERSYHYDNDDYESLIPLPIKLQVPAVSDLTEIRGLRIVGKEDDKESHLIVDRWQNEDFDHHVMMQMDATITGELLPKLLDAADQFSRHAVRVKVPKK